MCLSIFFAKIMGIYFLTMSLASLIHQKRLHQIDHQMMAIPSFVTAIGSKSLLFGLLTFIPLSLWVCKWIAILPLMAWVMSLRGVMLLFSPSFIIRFFRKILENRGVLLISWIWFLSSLYLVSMGFLKR